MEIRGKYNTAAVMADSIDNTARAQIEALCSQEIFKDSKIRIMPDCHAGLGCVIGFTANLRGRVIPNLVGVDISCSISAYRLDASEIDFEKLDNLIRRRVPCGESVRKDVSPLLCAELRERIVEAGREILSSKEICMRDLRSVGTLGSGNHFLEIGRDGEGALWLSIHCGSRNFGHRVCSFHQLKAAPRAEIPKPLWYIEGGQMELYAKHVKVAQDFAAMNHRVILDEICSGMGWNVMESVFTNHNYIEFLESGEIMIRKGAISAKAGERVIIPMNMRDGSLLGVGKGNPDWNFSAPHGAGRALSRSEAHRQLSLDDFKSEMKNVWSTCVKNSTLDEAPMAYKPMESVTNFIGGSVEISGRLLPVYNFKG